LGGGQIPVGAFNYDLERGNYYLKWRLWMTEMPNTQIFSHKLKAASEEKCAAFEDWVEVNYNRKLGLFTKWRERNGK
jgi:hypothetical protein